jgi:Domain of unknown function (DUF4190)
MTEPSPPNPSYGPPNSYAPPPHLAGYGPPPGYGYYAPASARTNGMAVASMVLGILWLWWLGSILALVFGYVAKRQISERGEGGGGMATAEIVLGWIGVGILAVLFVL